jgi:DNA recombination protein RmuC
MTRHLVKMGRGLERAVEAYNQGIGSLEHSVLPAARRFRDLEATTGEEIAVLEPVDRAVRALNSGEMIADDGGEASPPYIAVAS